MPDFFIDRDIAKAKTIDTDFYTQQKFYEDAKEKIFASSWQFIGDANDSRKCRRSLIRLHCLKII